MPQPGVVAKRLSHAARAVGVMTPDGRCRAVNNNYNSGP